MLDRIVDEFYLWMVLRAAYRALRQDWRSALAGREHAGSLGAAELGRAALRLHYGGTLAALRLRCRVVVYDQ